MTHSCNASSCDLMTGASGIQGHPGQQKEKSFRATVLAVSNKTEQNWKRKENQTKKQNTDPISPNSQRVNLEAMLTTAPLSLIWASLETRASEMNGPFSALKQHFQMFGSQNCLIYFKCCENTPKVHWQGFCLSILY